MKKVSLLMACAVFVLDAVAADALDIAPEQQKALGITVQAPQAVSDVLSERLPAQVVIPNAQLQVVSAPQAGVIQVLLVAVGEDVKRGQPIARIQSASLLEAEREYLQALTQLQLARTNLERDRRLFKDGIIAERRYLEARSKHAELAAAASQYHQALRLAGMSDEDISKLEKRGELTSSLTVVSPLDGVVLEQMAVAGQRVEAVSPLYRVGSLKPLWLEIHVPLDRLQGLSIGTRVEVASARIQGRLITIGRGVHAVDQGVLLRAEVTEGAERLRPGQFVEVRIAEAGSARRRYRLPKAAMVRSSDQAYVFVQVPQGFRPQPVSIQSEQGDEVVVTGDIKDTDLVAVTGIAAIKAAQMGIGTEAK